MPTPGASDLLTPAPALVARFHDDYAGLPMAAWSRPTLVAVSGGVDSVALLLLMHAELGPLCRAATVDHGLRPEAALEADFVSGLCGRLGVPHKVLRGPLPDRVAGSANLSQRARALRYHLLEEHRAAIGAGCIATAHHADDQLETVIMRLNRGSGLAGLAGIRASQDRVIRPLLRWRRHELATIVRDAGLVAVDDPSNRDDRYDRARLRKVLADIDWLDAANVARSADHLSEAEEALEWAMDELAARYWSLDDDEASHAGFTMPSEIRRRVVRRCILHIDPNADCNGPAIDRVIARLERGDATTIGGVMCRNDFVARLDVTQIPIWTYRPAPPRRNA